MKGRKYEFLLISIIYHEFGTSEFWQYDERKLTKDEYNALRAELLETELTNTQLALTELYESILEG